MALDEKKRDNNNNNKNPTTRASPTTPQAGGQHQRRLRAPGGADFSPDGGKRGARPPSCPPRLPAASPRLPLPTGFSIVFSGFCGSTPHRLGACATPMQPAESCKCSWMRLAVFSDSSWIGRSHFRQDGARLPSQLWKIALKITKSGALCCWPAHPVTARRPTRKDKPPPRSHCPCSEVSGPTAAAFRSAGWWAGIMQTGPCVPKMGVLQHRAALPLTASRAPCWCFSSRASFLCQS